MIVQCAVLAGRPLCLQALNAVKTAGMVRANSFKATPAKASCPTVSPTDFLNLPSIGVDGNRKRGGWK